MRPFITFIALFSLATLALAADKPAADKEEGFVQLFDGKTLDGWTPNEKPEAFAIEDGCIVCKNGFAHLFYTGDVNKHEFKNFELRAEFKFIPGSNSGIFFHTANEGKGLVKKGYECQICSDGHKDPRKTGSLYAIEDVKESAAKDNEWSTYTIRVEGKHITLKVNDKVTVDYTEPENPKREKGRERRLVSSGTFALQGHDAQSKTWFKNIRVKILPD